jgi:5-methylthioribose kinase
LGGVSFELSVDTAHSYLVARQLVPEGVPVRAEELQGGVSAVVVAVRGPGVALVVKQALPRLRVADEWLAKQERTETEAAAMGLCDRLTPGRVPQVLDSDPSAHVLVMELLPDAARNWQFEVAEGRSHAAVGRWAGETLGLWHARTAGDKAVAGMLDDFDSFEQLRLSPFFETVIERRPDLEAEIAPRLAELRELRRCFVDGDFAMKNILVAPRDRWVLDFEVAHYGNPVFDLGFFLSFVVLSAIRWPQLAAEMRFLAEEFLAGYAAQAGGGFAGDGPSVTAHTACLVLARTDGKSPAQFLDDPSRERARAVGIALLRAPADGLWAWP